MTPLSVQDASGVVLNILAFAGVAAFLLLRSDGARQTPVEVRLNGLFTLLLALVAVRTVRWAFEVDDLRRAEEALAAMLPLAALVLAEGLMRRHAPGPLKRGLLGGAALVAIFALVRPRSLDLAFVATLGVFVAGGLVSVAVLLVLRNRRSLAPAENAAIGALGLGLVSALPFIASDFLHAAGMAPVRAGGLGLLVVVYAAARLTGAGADGRAVLTDLALAALSAVVAYLTFTALMGAPHPDAGLAFLSIILGLVLVILIVQALREQSTARDQDALLQALADAPAANLDAFLDRVLAAPALKGAVVLEEAALADYDAQALRSTLAASPVAALPDLRTGGRQEEALAALLDSHEGTHAVLLNDKPLRILCVTLPGLGAGPRIDLCLQLLQRLAMLAARPA